MQMTYTFPRNGRFTAFRSASTTAADSSNFGSHRDQLDAVETTHLERRVLAHERILQSLISHLAEADPEVLSRLKLAFGKGHNLGDYEQDYTSTEHYGDHFIRAIEALIGRNGAPRAPAQLDVNGDGS
jgi:hypothetical protein